MTIIFKNQEEFDNYVMAHQELELWLAYSMPNKTDIDGHNGYSTIKEIKYFNAEFEDNIEQQVFEIIRK